MMKKIIALAASMLLAVGLTACGSVQLTNISLPEDMQNIAMKKGETINLSEKALLQYNKDNASDEKIAKAIEAARLVWKSSNEDVATIDQTGKITAVNAGLTKVSVTNEKKTIFLEANVSVSFELEDIKVIDKLELQLEEGKDITTTVTVDLVPSDVKDCIVSFKSADETIATVDEKGVVIAKLAGVTAITVIARVENNLITKEIVVTVLPVEDKVAEKITTEKKKAPVKETTAKTPSSSGNEPVTKSEPKPEAPKPEPAPAPSPTPTPPPVTPEPTPPTTPEGGQIHDGDLVMPSPTPPSWDAGF